MIEKAGDLEMEETVSWGELKRMILRRLACKMALLTHPPIGKAHSSTANREYGNNSRMN